MAAPKGNQYALGNNGGRPSKYQPEFCEKVIELGKEGKSLTQMCAHFDISRQTIDNWAEQNPEFLEALTRARVHMQAKLEEMGFDGLTSREFNAAVWKTTMQARFPWDYTERREHKIDGQIDIVDKTPVEMARMLNFAVHQLAHDHAQMEAEGLQGPDNKPEDG